MSGTVPALSIFFMVITCILSIGTPIALFLYLRFVRKADVYPFFAGCSVMLLFAFILEQGAHRVILSSSAGETIRNNLWLYALYGGLMAGLFEETGRYLCFSFALKRYRAKNVNALMYGAGHGGFESIVLAGLTMINNITWSYMINSGNAAALTAPLSGDALAQAEAGIAALISTPSYHGSRHCGADLDAFLSIPVGRDRAHLSNYTAYCAFCPCLVRRQVGRQAVSVSARYCAAFRRGCGRRAPFRLRRQCCPHRNCGGDLHNADCTARAQGLAGYDVTG